MNRVNRIVVIGILCVSICMPCSINSHGNGGTLPDSHKKVAAVAFLAVITGVCLGYFFEQCAPCLHRIIKPEMVVCGVRAPWQCGSPVDWIDWLYGSFDL